VHELTETVDANCPAEELDSNTRSSFFTLRHYGKTEGILHTTGGYLLQAHLTTNGFSISRRGHLLVHADIGWVTGHSYVVYGRCRTANALMYEGAPLARPDRFCAS